jgi:hypothetical protein
MVTIDSGANALPSAGASSMGGIATSPRQVATS